MTKLLRVMGNVSPGFQAYLESQTPERQRDILKGVRQFDRERMEVDTALETAYADSFEGWADSPAGGFHNTELTSGS